MRAPGSIANDRKVFVNPQTKFNIIEYKNHNVEDIVKLKECKLGMYLKSFE